MGSSIGYSIRKEVAIEDFPEGALALLCNELGLISLNPLACDVLDRLEVGQSCSQVVDALALRYDQPRERVNHDVRELLDDLERSGVLERRIAGEEGTG